MDMAVGAEQRIDHIVLRPLVFGLDRYFAPGCAQDVDDLVLEDADRVGAQRRAAAKLLRFFQQRQQRILHHILGQAAIAQLQQGKSQ